MEEESQTNEAPLIFGKPFLKIVKTKIDVYKGNFSIEFGDDVVKFNIINTIEHLEEWHSIFKLEILDILVKDNFSHMFQQNSLDKVFKPEIVKLLAKILEVNEPKIVENQEENEMDDAKVLLYLQSSYVELVYTTQPKCPNSSPTSLEFSKVFDITKSNVAVVLHQQKMFLP